MKLLKVLETYWRGGRIRWKWQGIEAGIPNTHEEAAARKQARIDSGQDIVGVNKYRLETEDPSDFRCRQPNGA
jgi:methylmalonyl-CoA mutase N-terminal domain/subunit